MVEQAVTPREAEVLRLLGEHLTNAEIAGRLYISQRTVETHVSSLLRKLGVTHRRELARRQLPTRPVNDAGPPMPPALELLEDAATFVGRAAGAIGSASDGPSPRRVTRCWSSSRVNQGSARADSFPSWPSRSTTEAGGCCSESATRRRRAYGPFLQAIADDELPGRTTSGDAVVDSIPDWLVTSASSGPLLLVIEDFHWSTSTTRDVLRHLVRWAGRVPLLIVATARDTRPDLDADLARLLADLERAPTVTRVACADSTVTRSPRSSAPAGQPRPS